MNLLRKLAVMSGLMLAVSFSRAAASTVTTEYTFTGGSDGAQPYGTLVLGSDSNFYGTAYAGGINYGTVFTISPQGAFTPLWNFTGSTDGANPAAGLAPGSNGLFYGTTYAGGTAGQGEAYSITAQGTLTPLYSFIGPLDGSQPYGALVQGVDSNFYGTTSSGGTSGGGTVFRLTPQGTLTTITEFNPTIGGGAMPLGTLVQGVDSLFYGTTYLGGLNGSGTVFKVTAGGILTTLHNFNGNNGAQPFAGLVLGSDTNFYGVTSTGGSGGAGTVFKISSQGTFNTLYNFSNGNNGGSPIGALVQGIDGNFFGTAAGGGSKNAGTIFQITPAGKLTTLYTFGGGADGGAPESALVADTVSNFFGTTSAGADGGGTIFDFVPPCNFSITPTHITFAATANSGSFTLSAASINCTWTTGTSAAWITITSPLSGAGSGTVAYAVAGNTNATSRTGAITVGGQAFAITQQAQVLGAFLQGTYTGLLTAEGSASNSNSGEISLVLSKTGSYTATVTIGGVASKFKGVFDAAGDATNTVVRPKLSPLQVSLQLLSVTNSTDQMTGTVSDGTFTSDVLADLAVFSKVNPSPFVGLYNLVFAPADSTDPTVPQGDGYGALTLTALGVGKLEGVLADGTKISVTAPISGYGTWPLYESLYNKLGACVGALTISESNTVSASVNWFRPPESTSVYYPTGFVTTVTVSGGIYMSPLVGGNPTISGNKTLTLSDGNLSSNLVKNIAIDGLGKVTVTPTGADKLTMKVTVATGEFSGAFIHPATGKSVKFNGVVLPGNSAGDGFFLGPNESGSVVYEPSP